MVAHDGGKRMPLRVRNQTAGRDLAGVPGNDDRAGVNRLAGTSEPERAVRTTVSTAAMSAAAGKGCRC
jgi:hypothetical protein